MRTRSSEKRLSNPRLWLVLLTSYLVVFAWLAEPIDTLVTQATLDLPQNPEQLSITNVTEPHPHPQKLFGGGAQMRVACALALQALLFFPAVLFRLLNILARSSPQLRFAFLPTQSCASGL